MPRSWRMRQTYVDKQKLVFLQALMQHQPRAYKVLQLLHVALLKTYRRQRNVWMMMMKCLYLHIWCHTKLEWMIWILALQVRTHKVSVLWFHVFFMEQANPFTVHLFAMVALWIVQCIPTPEHSPVIGSLISQNLFCDFVNCLLFMPLQTTFRMSFLDKL